MLSRIAEALYWIGRYVERAEDTARVLDVGFRASLEGRGDDDGSASIAAILNAPVLTRTELLERSLDRTASDSIAWTVRRARENARTVREAITSEMWEALNTWHLSVAATGPGDLEGAGAHRFFSTMKERAFLTVGTADGTMLRDEGWEWLTIGRYLERVLFTCRVIGVRSGLLVIADGGRATPAETYGWTSLLRSMSAFEAYHRTYHTAVEPARVAEFLLLDPDFPRSALYSARHIESAVARVVVDSTSGARHAAGRLRAELEFREVDEVIAEGVTSFVSRVTDLCNEVHGDLVAECLSRGAPSEAPA